MINTGIYNTISGSHSTHTPIFLGQVSWEENLRARFFTSGLLNGELLVEPCKDGVGGTCSCNSRVCLSLGAGPYMEGRRFCSLNYALPAVHPSSALPDKAGVGS